MRSKFDVFSDSFWADAMAKADNRNAIKIAVRGLEIQKSVNRLVIRKELSKKIV